MSTKIPTNSPKKKEVLDDNARKFIARAIDPQFLNEHKASSFTLITDWLETGEDNEKKVAYKGFDNGDIQILLISKVTKDGNRTSKKEQITEQTYKDLVATSVLHLKKKRHEFTYTQNAIPFSMKYDEFANGEFCMLEVDAPTEEKRDAFNPNDFPSELTEVTGDMRYYGYRVAHTLQTSPTL